MSPRCVILVLVTSSACKDTTGGSGGSATATNAADPTSSSSDGGSGAPTGTGPTDEGGIEGECSLWEQDCPDGDKCMPWTDAPDLTPDEIRCCPEVQNGKQKGDECTVDEYFGACLDDCKKGLLCLDVDNDGLGFCSEFCQGTPDTPLCEADETCFIYFAGIPLCFRVCDPLVQDCGDGQGCYPDDVQSGTGFVCLPVVGGGDVGDPCWLLSNCAPGLICVTPEFFPDCENALGAGCCTGLCEMDQPDSCPDLRPQLECLSWWYQGQEPHPGLENLGACSIPP